MRFRNLAQLLAITALTAGASASTMTGCAAAHDDGDGDEASADLVGRGDLYTGKWTNWYHENRLIGLRKLQVMREWLQSSNLFDPHAAGSRVTVNGRELSCSAEAQKIRQIDGSCNDLSKPWMGAAGVRFGRNVPFDRSMGDPARVLSPNPRDVSRVLLTRDQGFKPVPFLNLLAATWIQFMTHDWISHGPVQDRASIPASSLFKIDLKNDDPFVARYGSPFMFIPQTVDDATRTAAESGMPPTYVNEVSSWWDGSQLYGNDLTTANGLREMVGGRLKVGAVPVDSYGRLPIGSDGIDKTGFNRNWWLGLSIMHHLFALEHNQIAAMLAEKHSDWSDQQIYDRARMINAAQQAKIHTIEWTPAILPLPTLREAMNANWKGLPLTGWFNLAGGDTNLHNVPYALTEEFTAVYRLHSLLPESVYIDGHLIPVADMRNELSHGISDTVAMPKIMFAFGTQHPGALTLNNYPAFMQDLKIPGYSGFDMAAVDVLRDRERGVPRYNEFRRQMQLKPVDRFEDLTSDATQLARLKQVYGPNGIEDLDLLVGSLAEANEHRPSDGHNTFGFGETQFQIFLLMASRRIEADRFLTKNFNDDTYGHEGMKWIEDSTLKKILLRNYPELANTGLANVESAFTPWY